MKSETKEQLKCSLKFSSSFLPTTTHNFTAVELQIYIQKLKHEVRRKTKTTKKKNPQPGM